MGGGHLPWKKRYGGVRFNIISVTRGWVGVKFPGKKRYITLEWPILQSIQNVLKCKGSRMIQFNPERRLIIVFYHTEEA